MNCVGAYGLSIVSEIALGDLPPCERDPDVTIRIGAAEAGPDTILLNVRGVARFAITGGRQISVDPVPGAALDSVRLFLMGSAFGALLYQRGLLVLHGNAVRIGDACMICVGPSGAGKSTLAAALAARGHATLADDVVAITPDHRALPGLPRIRLWQDAAERLGHDTATLARIRPGFDKYALPAEPVTESLPVRWIHVLAVEEREGIACTQISGAARFQALRDNAYRPEYVARTLGEVALLERCAGLAGGVAMFRTMRPAQGFSLDGMVETLLAQCRVPAPI